MSYILDALKKSDQERKQATPPSIHSLHKASFDATKSRTKKVKGSKLFILATLLFAGGMLFSTFLLKPGTSPISLPSGSASKTTASITPETAPTTEPASISTVHETTAKTAAFDDETTVEVSTKLTISPEQEVETVIQPPPRIIKSKKKILLQPLPQEEQLARLESVPQTMGESFSEKRPGVPLFSDLPVSMQSALPSLKFAGHTYSDEPSQRMIIINNRILREGNAIDHETRLQEITWDGVILEFEGKTFLMKTEL